MYLAKNEPTRKRRKLEKDNCSTRKQKRKAEIPKIKKSFKLKHFIKRSTTNVIHPVL